MHKLQTLNEMSHLEASGFGRPEPRHGLRLLYWFANECLYFDSYNNMCWNYNPVQRYFGFHPFMNRPNNNGVRLLPYVHLRYYELGNLSRPGACYLPQYITEDYTGYHNSSNRDRIIVSLDDECGCFDRVYVTKHKGQSNYNLNATYRISKGLLMIIQTLTLEDFLWEAGY